VFVAIHADFMHALEMPRLLAFAPQLAARAREIDGLARARRLLQRFAVHPGEHQHLAAAAVLGNRWNEALGVEAHLVEPAHCRTSTPRRPMSALASPTVYSPKWKMLAASTASARPCRTPSAK